MKNSKKVSVKKIVSVVAVAVAIGAAATVTAQAATGVFNPAFGEIFAGQPANGVFPGSDVSVKSNDLDVEFVGVTGDETEMYSIYNITKKDGSNFVESTEDYCFLGTNAKMEVSESAFKKLRLMMDGSRGMSDGVSYDFVDSKTIRATVVFSDTAGCIKGERLTVNDTDTSIYHIDEVLYSEKSDTELGCTKYMEENKALINQKKATFKDNQFIIPIYGKDGIYRLAVTTVTTIPFEYEMGVKLNYKTTEKNFEESVGKKFNALKSDWTIKEIKAGSFSISISAETDHNNMYDGFDVNDMDNWSPEKLHEYLNIDSEISVEITLKDGTKVKAKGMSQSRTEENGKSDSIWNLSYYIGEDSSESYALDANEIVSIRYNDTELIG